MTKNKKIKIFNYFLECQTLYLDKPGSDYTGTVSVTKSGKTCQKWSLNSPHGKSGHSSTHTFMYENNYCRNFDVKTDAPDGVWCYTTDPKLRFEYCSQIPGKFRTFISAYNRKLKT